MRHMLQMIIHLVLHVEDDPLGDPGVDIAFENRNHLRGRERHKRQDQEADQQRHVLSHQRLIHDPSRNDAREQAEHGRYQDRHKDQHKLQPVGKQIGQNPPDQSAVYFGHVLFFFVREEAPRPQAACRRWHRITVFLYNAFHDCFFLLFRQYICILCFSFYGIKP